MKKVIKMKIKLYVESEVVSHGKTGWYYSEPRYPIEEAEFHRWI